MLLKNAMDLKQSIEEYRQRVFELTVQGNSELELKRIKKDLDEKMVKLQKHYLNLDIVK